MRVIIESDCCEMVNLVNDKHDIDHSFWQVILDCKNLHRRLWSSSVTHVPRTSNTTADCIALCVLQTSLFGL